MDSYIVRVYQREANRLVGVVESTGNEEHPRVFHDAGELWQILSAPHDVASDKPPAPTPPRSTD